MTHQECVDYLKKEVNKSGLTTVKNRRAKALEVYVLGGVSYCSELYDFWVLDALEKGQEPNERHILSLIDDDCGGQFHSYEELHAAATSWYPQ